MLKQNFQKIEEYLSSTYMYLTVELRCSSNSKKKKSFNMKFDPKF